jgi:hypothetical protein
MLDKLSHVISCDVDAVGRKLLVGAISGVRGAALAIARLAGLCPVHPRLERNMSVHQIHGPFGCYCQLEGKIVKCVFPYMYTKNLTLVWAEAALSIASFSVWSGSFGLFASCA